MATLKRDDLYADVWSRPATTIAAELGLLRNTLKRLCAGMDVPTVWRQLNLGTDDN